MVFNTVLNNFTSGEWSPKMLARTDTEQYPRAAKEITNGFVRPQGGIFRRPGFERKPYDITVQAILNGDHVLIPYYVRGKRFLIVMGEGAAFGQDADTWEPYSVVHSFEVPLPINPYSIRHTQIGDTLFLTSDSTPPITIVPSPVISDEFIAERYTYYNSVNNGRAGNVWDSFPFGPVNADGIGGTLTVTGTLTAGGSVTLVSTVDMFYPEMVGVLDRPNMVIKITSAGNTAAIRITGVTDTKNAAGVMMSAKTGSSPLAVGTAAGTAYELAAWNGKDGWPTTVTAIQNRLVFAKGPTLYFSRAGNYYSMMENVFQQSTSPTPAANASDGSRPFAAAPFATGVVTIRELTAAKTLFVLTDSMEIVGFGGSNGISALPGGFIVESSSTFGTLPVAPVRVNNFVTFPQANGKTLRDLTFNWELSQYKSMDLSFPAEHLFRGKTIRSMVSAELDGSFLFVLMTDGTLIQCTLDRDYAINAWTRVDVAGYRFESVGVVESFADKNLDVLYATLSPIAGGDTIVVRLAETYETATINPAGPFPEYMDLFTYIQHMTPIKTITGLTAYEGKEVQVIADGFYQGKFTVSGGQVTVPQAHSLALVGIPVKFRLESMPIESGARLGDATGKSKRVDTAFIRFFNTLGARYGCPQTNEYYDVPFREDSQPMDEPSKMRDMDIELSFPGSYSKVATVVVESDYPFPCNVLGIGVQGVTNE